MNTTGETYRVCERCGYVVKAGEYHLCPLEHPISYSEVLPPNKDTVLGHILDALLRIEKLLEKEL